MWISAVFRRGTTSPSGAERDRSRRNGRESRNEHSVLCNIELGKFPPPSEEKLRSIAHELGHDSDELLAKAGKTASDLSVIINKYPRQFAAILRSLRKFRESDFQVLVNGLAQQFKPDAVPADPPWSATRKEKTHAQIPVDWKLLVKAFAE